MSRQAFLIADLSGTSYTGNTTAHRPYGYGGNLFVVLPLVHPTNQHKIYRSTDGGVTWSAVQTYAAGNSTYTSFAGRLRTHVSGSTLYIVHYNGAATPALCVSTYNMATDTLTQYASGLTADWYTAPVSAIRSDASIVIGVHPVGDGPLYLTFSGGSFSGTTTLASSVYDCEAMCAAADDRVHFFLKKPNPPYGWYHNSLSSGGALAGITLISAADGNYAATDAVSLEASGSSYPTAIWRTGVPNRSVHGLNAPTPTWTVQDVPWAAGTYNFIDCLVASGDSVIALGFDNVDLSRILTNTLDASGNWSASTTLFHDDAALFFDSLAGNVIDGQLVATARTYGNSYWYIREVADGLTITVPSIGPGVVVGDPSLGAVADILVPSIDPTLVFGLPVINGATQYAARYRAV